MYLFAGSLITQRRRNDHEGHVVSNSHEYEQLFSRYTLKADGKAKVAQALVELLRERGHRRQCTVLDVGAGNGAIAARLAATGLSVIAVEPNPAFGPVLATLRPAGVRHVRTRVEDMPAELGPVDAAIASYVLDSVPPAQVGRFCSAIDRVLRDDGDFLGVTYAEQAAWWVYSQAVERTIGPCLTGGQTRCSTRYARRGARPNPCVC